MTELCAAAELDLDPALATCVQQSLRGSRLAAAPPDTEPRPGTVSAFGMHSATTVDGRDRKRLERVCRYLLRPPFAHDAVEAKGDGRGCGSSRVQSQDERRSQLV